MPVRLRIMRTQTDDRRPSLRIVAKTLSSVQRLANELGRARAAVSPVFAGRSEAEIERECELFIGNIAYASVDLVLETALPPKELWDDYAKPALGPLVEDDLRDFIQAVEAADLSKLESIAPDPTRRERALRAFLAGLPAPDSGYVIQWASGRDPLRPIQRPTSEQIARLLCASAGEPDKVQANWAMIEGTCIATIGKDGRPTRVNEWLDYTVVSQQDTEPYVTSQVAGDDRLFILAQPITCPVTVEDHLLVLQYEPLGIRAYAATREEAVQDFGEEFAFRYDDYALAPDHELTRSAIELKRRLRELVKEVRVLEAQESTVGREEPDA